MESLHVLLGLPDTVDVDRLRYAYEGAVAAAAARHDWARCARLSAAFDALPRSTQSAMYGGSGAKASVASAGLGGSAAAPPTAGRARGRAARRLEQRWDAETGSCPPARRRGRHVVTWIVAAFAVFVVSGFGVRWLGQHPAGGQPPVRPALLSPATLTVSDAPIGAGSPFRIPENSPVNKEGLATVTCSRVTNGVSQVYMRMVPPGTIVSCPNGAVPVVQITPNG